MKTATLVFYGVALGLLLVGLRELLSGFEENKCSMTYMFEYPEYRRVALPRHVTRLYPAYNLYLYGEGVYAQETRGLKLTGAPVLFLPGNAGSYKQRSLGSVALRKAETMEGSVHFNVFTVDFNEELVALYGGSLQRQTRFLHESIKAILRLYKHLKNPPHHVVLVGHSMGGVVARALFTLPRFNTSLVKLIITQASPHLAPVLALDPHLLFYSAVRQKWVKEADKLRNITVLSIAGGYRDYQVRSGLTSLPCSSGDNNKLSLATAVPRTWVSTDHLSIVCKELVLATVRAFFDLVDPETKQFTANPMKKMAVLNHHFVRHPVRMVGDTDLTPTSFSDPEAWSEVNTLRLVYNSPKEGQVKYFLFALSSRRRVYSHFYCRSSNLQEMTAWVYGCTHKIGSTQFTVECEWQRQVSRTLSVSVPHVLSFLSTSDVSINSSGLLHIIELQHFHQVYQAFRITVESQCKVDKRSANVYRVKVPWFGEDVPSVTEVSGMLHTSRPDNTSCVLLHIHTAPNCHYKVSVRTSLPRMLGQILRFCGPMVPVYVAVTLLLACGGQLRSIQKTKRAVNVSKAVAGGLQLHKVNLPVFILHLLLEDIWSTLGLPAADVLPASSPDTSFREDLPPVEEWPHLLSPLLYMFGAAVAYWGSSLLSLLVQVTSLLLAPLHPSISRDCGTLRPWTQVLVTVCLAVTGRGCCGAVSVFAAFLLHFYRVLRLQMTERSLSHMLNLLSESTLQEVRDDLQLHLCLSALFTLPVMLSAPSFIHWFRNLYSCHLDPDPCSLYTVPLVIVYVMLININTSALTH
uniref:GPI inositol-deacylase n=1 Tax=Cynoglossus semilaevis TaxID=244447 RepID=A0A3P8WAI7_CYNSE